VTGQQTSSGLRRSRRQAPESGGRRPQRPDDGQVSPLLRAGHMAVLVLVLTPIVLVLCGVATLLVMLLFVGFAG
jgi:hypothetical protein